MSENDETIHAKNLYASEPNNRETRKNRPAVQDEPYKPQDRHSVSSHPEDAHATDDDGLRQTRAPQDAPSGIDAIVARDRSGLPHVNPLLSDASDLLYLLGKLSTGGAIASSTPLYTHVSNTIRTVRRRLLANDIEPESADATAYVLAAVADDIVLNLPQNDLDHWQRSPLALQYAGNSNTGEELFERLDGWMRHPHRNRELLQLVHACLSIGFQGRYRRAAGGREHLIELRAALHDMLRREEPDEAVALSPQWRPQVKAQVGKYRRVPLWAVAGVAMLLCMGTFAALVWKAGTDYARVEQAFQAVTLGEITLPAMAQVQVPAVPAGPPALILENEARVQVTWSDPYYKITIPQRPHFATGSANLPDGIEALLPVIATALDRIGGTVIVRGHSDSVPMSRPTPPRNNTELSARRAGIVAAQLQAVPGISNLTIQFEGMGSTDLITRPATGQIWTDAHHLQNRRFEIFFLPNGERP